MRPPKTEMLCEAKDTVNKTKRQPTEWEKLFTNPHQTEVLHLSEWLRSQTPMTDYAGEDME